jgi:hypothetical protein
MAAWRDGACTGDGRRVTVVHERGLIAHRHAADNE